MLLPYKQKVRGSSPRPPTTYPFCFRIQEKGRAGDDGYLQIIPIGELFTGDSEARVIATECNLRQAGMELTYPLEAACGLSSISRIFPTSVSELNGFGTNGMLRAFSGRNSAFSGYADM